MCAFCGPPPSQPGWFDAGIPDGLPARLRARESVVRIAAAVTDQRVVGVGSQPGGTAISVTTRDGRAVAVDDYGDLWAAIEALTGVSVPAVGSS